MSPSGDWQRSSRVRKVAPDSLYSLLEDETIENMTFARHNCACLDTGAIEDDPLYSLL
jgi:hypothetical protein